MVTHFKKVPAQFPPIIPNKTNVVSYEVMFDEKAEYNLSDIVQQEDWNKLLGLKFNYFKPKENSLMIAWRYSRGMFQTAPYMHLDGNYFPSLPYVYLEKRVCYIMTVINNNGVLTATCIRKSDNKLMFTYSQDFNIKASTWEISSWFGGDILPPKTIKFYKKKLKYND